MDSTFVHENEPVADLFHETEGMTDDNNSTRRFDKIQDPFFALFSELWITDPEHLIDEENLWFDRACDGQTQAGLHARRIGSEGFLDELTQFAEGEDICQHAIHRLLRVSEYAPVEVHIFSAGEIWIQTNTHACE